MVIYLVLKFNEGQPEPQVSSTSIGRPQDFFRLESRAFDCDILCRGCAACHRDHYLK